MTVHKSQGGTFEKIVFDYHKGLQQQLVYVALSGVKSLQGLFLTNKDRDHTFYHTSFSSNPKFKALRTEIKRLEKHQFNTLDHEALELFKRFETILLNFNVQSLGAHIEDIISDTILMKAGILCFSETRTPPSDHPTIPQLRLLVHNRRPSVVGGVAIYVKNDLKISNSITFRPDIGDDDVGDLCAAQFDLNGRKFNIVSVYLNPGICQRDLEMFFYQVRHFYCIQLEPKRRYFNNHSLWRFQCGH